ncbi:terminase small subunit [Leptospira kirschneri str. 200801774]|uniref:terminase small subunit n=1 Tax=Leptospira kirschneri TaxID=29507 RepID=UPI0002BFB016|nr:terminase small subunit [Leptospira kirschneri]EMO78548.1 terminase small subunit [Leptospira kirschneri str. 200801774]
MSDPPKKPKKPRKKKGNRGPEAVATSEIISIEPPSDDGTGEDLTPKRKLFVENLVFSCMMNQTKAYMQTYGTDNVHSANACASRLLSKASVREYRDKLISESLEHKKSELLFIFLNVTRAISTAEISDYIDEFGEVSLERIRTINPQAVKEISTTVTTTKDGEEIVNRKFKLEGKHRSLEHIAKYLRLGEEQEARPMKIVFGPDEAGL